MVYKKSMKIKKRQFRKKTKRTQRGCGNVSGKSTPAPEPTDDDLESRITEKEKSRHPERPTIMTSLSLDDYDVESATPTPKNDTRNRITFSPTPFGSRPTSPLSVGTTIIQTTPTRPGKKTKPTEQLNSYQIKIEEDETNNNDDVIFEDLKKKEKMKDIISQAAFEALKRKEDVLSKKAQEWNTEFDNQEKKQLREDITYDWKQRQKLWGKNKQMKELTEQENRERMAAESADATAREVVWEDSAKTLKYLNKKRGNRWWANEFDKDRKNKGGRSKKNKNAKNKRGKITRKIEKK